MGEQPELYEYEPEPKNRGYELLRKDVIRCANCKKPLVDVIKVKEDINLIKETKANCPYCGDESFVYRTTGEVFMQASDGVSIVNPKVEFVNNIIKQYMEMMKNE